MTRQHSSHTGPDASGPFGPALRERWALIHAISFFGACTKPRFCFHLLYSAPLKFPACVGRGSESRPESWKATTLKKSNVRYTKQIKTIRAVALIFFSTI